MGGALDLLDDVAARFGVTIPASDRIAALDPTRARIAALDQELRDLDRRCQGLSRDLFSIFWEDVSGDTLHGVPTGELRERIRAYRRARDERHIREEAVRTRTSVETRAAGPDMRLPGAAATAIGLVLIMLGLADNTFMLILGSISSSC